MASLTAPAILAAMLRVGQPGHADLSRVYLPIDDCDASCVSTFERLRGPKPALDFTPTVKGWRNPPTWLGWSVKETRLEGLSRYVTIARAIDVVVHDPPDEWRRHPTILARLLVTISRHESAWWRGVHDCTHRGPAGEKGLFQIHPVLPEFKDVECGVDIDSTVNQVDIAAKLLGRFWKYCDGDLEGMIAAYGSGAGCEPVNEAHAERVGERLATFERTFNPVRFGVDEIIALTTVPGWEPKIEVDALRRSR
jgi:hypothetical protein